MTMNRIATSIRNRLSLRQPQAESLSIMADLADSLTLKKPTPDPSREGSFLKAELDKVAALQVTEPLATDLLADVHGCTSLARDPFCQERSSPDGSPAT